MTMRRVAALAGLLLAATAATAHAAPGHRILVYTDPAAADLPVAAAVTAWDKARGVQITTTATPCAGPDCVRVTRSTDWSLYPYAGYAFPQPDGSCVVTIPAWSGGAYVTAHELGHCIGLGHVTDDRRSVMQPVTVQGISGPDSADLRRLTRLYGG